ncbi:sigma-70 family RNA polymerase sigma factor [Allokutzneria albata]|uniref:RNA polymerase sigma factor n=1 Tax=Allokutzneria albata TaxID=211114 RepID=A0A1G9VTH3_ALLAB|nr:sigma-70 family RNA polymerase sigma factor [Allokutzneria albata]SDM75145.1 RNA polymerase, sigma subunit, ECF family [Allokutzneria albata]
MNAFPAVADPFRRELVAHCYRMVGSVHDAEDLVQETYLRAWRAYDKFEQRSSVRTWLYRIATRVCLTALEGRGRRPLPTGLGGPRCDPGDDLVQPQEISWLEPFPDRDDDPATIVVGRESLRLALVAALQHLPPRQRAVLVLRDVLQWRAAEVAEALEISVAAVNSLLQRARAQLESVAPQEEQLIEQPEQRELLDRYVRAFETKNVAAIVELFTADAVWEMPPFTAWYQGRADIERHLRERCPAVPGGQRLIPISANGQPAFANYLRGPDGAFRAFNIQVLTIGPSGVSHAAVFLDTSLYAAFGLPEVL